MIQRKYRGPQDIKLLQDFNSAAITETNGCGYLQPGDVPHHVFNGNKFFDPSEILTIWEDAFGIAAWILVGPRMKLFDAQVRPDLRNTDLEYEILTYAYERLLNRMIKYTIEGDKVFCDSFKCDLIRSNILLGLGWTLDSPGKYIINHAALDSLSDPELPTGYSIRATKGMEEAQLLAEVHSKAFGTEWTKKLYQKVMESPGYSPEREFVVIAPNGTFAAFIITWYDLKNKTGYFEPVGVHEDYRRLGLGRAMLKYGMQQMYKKDMGTAIVANFTNNKSAFNLYKKCGFKPKYYIDYYSKSI